MPRWNSKGEKECRARIERQKDRYVRSARRVDHPCLGIRNENLDIARSNIRRHDWAKAQWDGILGLADHYASRSPGLIDVMIPELTPLHVYGTFCPVCEVDNTYRMVWDYRDPERLVCFHCGAVMTDQAFEETGRMDLPRSGQTFTHYLRPAEREDPDRDAGTHAFVWAGRKARTSWLGAIRQQKTHHMPGVARALAIAYRITGEDRYARASATILKRFAAVYPGYLFHDYWHTFMDCDPLYACELMARDEGIGRYEVNPCPDQPARSPMKSGKLVQTFWGCGRLSCGGVMADGRQITILAEALDLLWEATDGAGRPFLTQAERDLIIRDLIVEGLYTFTHWEGINNKVAGCRVGEVALGRFIGAPRFVHRGVEGFVPYLEGFFERDGSTAEGSSYYLYAVSNVRELPEMARGYSDPPSYRKKDRYDNLDLYDKHGAYRTVLRARTLMTQPDGRLPHTADAVEGQSGWPGPAWLHETGFVRLGREFAPFVDLKAGDEFALFHRPPGAKPADPPPVRDRYFPAWRLAIFNTGYSRMFQQNLSGTATFLMNFYEPGGHDHPDALNIAMVAEGVEVLSDLGYIGDHPLNASIRSTLKHNLVVVDRKEQLLRGRRPPGSLIQLAASPRVKVIEAECRAYEEADVYRRCCVMVDRADGPAYLVDCFRVKGGTQHDYAIHGEGRLTGLPESSDGPLDFRKRRGVLGRDIGKLQVCDKPSGAWSAAWSDEGTTMRTHVLSPVDGVTVGEGPGQRSHNEVGVRKDYLFASRPEAGKGNAFVTLIDHYRERSDIDGIQLLDCPDGTDGPVCVRVDRRTGQDTVMMTSNGGSVTAHGISLKGRTAVCTRQADGGTSAFLSECEWFECDSFTVVLSHRVLEGGIASFDESGFRAEHRIPATGHADTFVQVADEDSDCWTAYAIKSIRGRTVKVDEFPFAGGGQFRLPSVLSLDLSQTGELDIRANVDAVISLAKGQLISSLTVNGRLLDVPERKTPGGRTILLGIGQPDAPRIRQGAR